MQHITLIQLLAMALAITWLAIPFAALHLVRSARTVGFDQGHEIARQASDHRIALLHEDIAALRRQQQTERTRHQLDREALIQDADRRIAEYARRSNPFTDTHLGMLSRTAATLDLAKATFGSLGARDKYSEAETRAAGMRVMHNQLKAALEAQYQNTETASTEAAA